MRIGIASIALEANTFNPVPTTLDHFREGVFHVGEDILQMRAAHHEVGGFLAGLADGEAEIVPLLVAAAAPGGAVTAETFDDLRQLLHQQIDSAPPLDGLLLAPHGAMVAENALDADGFWMQEIRDRVGRHIPIVATIDPHANLSPAMVAATDAIVAYKSNPHVDQRARGKEAASLVMAAASGKVQLRQAASFPPLAIEIERQYSSEGAYEELLKLSEELQQNRGILSSSIVLGFPYADVPELGAAAIVVADGNLVDPEGAAEFLGQEIWSRRYELRSKLVSMADAVRQGISQSGTTCLLDMGDNVGGGSPGDCTAILEEIIRQDAGRTLAVIIDAAAASRASLAGVGADVDLEIGGKLDGTAGQPIRSNFRVVAVSDGRFSEEEPRHGGQQHFDQGISAVVKNRQLTLALISKRVPPFSLRQVTHLGVNPRDFRFVVAKGVHAPVAAYADAVDRFVRVDSPGITAAAMSNFHYVQRRRPLFPCEPSTSWK